LILVLESVEKPGNLGAIMRVADGVGATGVIICDEHTDIWNPNTIRASIGTIFSTQLAVASSKQVYNFLKQNNVCLFAAEVRENSKNYTDVNFKIPSAIIMGTEAGQVSDFWLEKSQTISLPMRGINSSLNVSTAAAVLSYEALRQRENS
jgi:TrmH family RNA methyltransferase